MSIFFIIDDRKTLEGAEEALIANVETGANIRKVARLVERNIQGIIETNESEDAKREQRLQRALREELTVLKLTEEEMADMIDVQIINSDGLILASLTDLETGGIHKFTDEVMDKILKGEVLVRGTIKYYDKYAIEAFVRYTANFGRSNDMTTFYLGAIRIIFSASGAKQLIDDMRLRHLGYVLLVSFSLSVLISILAVSTVIRPVKRLMKVVTEAENGNLDVRTSQSYSNDVIGKLAFGIDKMLRRIKTTQTERIEALGDMARGVAHEIKNPLNTLGLAVDNVKYALSEFVPVPKAELQRKLDDEIALENIEEAQECLEIMSDQITRLSQITEGFLDLTRPTQLDFRTTDLDDFIEEVLADFTLQLSETEIKVVRAYCQKLKDVKIDQSQMQKAISNIIQNGIQAMPRGGKIYVTTERIVAESGDMAVISIRDTGVGIPEEIMVKIFDAYFTTRNKEGGTGLGLAMTRKIIELHNGNIDVESMVGAGASFRITLPVIRRDA